MSIPAVGLLKFSDVRLHEATVVHVAVQLTVLVDEFLDEIDGRHRLTVLRETSSVSPKTTNLLLFYVNISPPAHIVLHWFEILIGHLNSNSILYDLDSRINKPRP